jgi:hypothetical protein
MSESNPISGVRLSNGEMIFGRVTKTETGLTVSNPAGIVQTPQGAGLVPWCPFFEFDRETGFEFDAEQVSYHCPLNGETQRAYQRNILGLDIPEPEKPSLATPGEIAEVSASEMTGGPKLQLAD